MIPLAFTVFPSIRYRPTTPLEFARPCGNCADFDINSRRADSPALADSTTAFAFWNTSFLSLSKYVTPVTRPLASVEISRTYEFTRTSQLPEAMASGIIVTAELDRAFTWQPKPEHMPQFTQPERPMYGCEMIAIGPLTTDSPIFAAAISKSAPEAL